MRCLQCERPAVTLCQACFAAQCEFHLAQLRQKKRRASALAGCDHDWFDGRLPQTHEQDVP